ncbi:50S ribosomal protein L25 [Tuwongella immobilis]|uniref:Large ribosomal subunit protein bL25 n=1 Tax=Tuwongella immobilis TaxID=692036 RepID=A0A6C2YU41_9BACT|nr:50S ribosomal protein L25 [Tuwongella immobilis]VIP04911.1 50s ribosomal protein l25 : 50S ribosomal protein L25 OS=Singulisphaera acidiphila (strain ATCC BAA-1392 / DSM 18658 / VKM B-2454 / MOB10) GN=rplY PE=3 SV=1: Ribosomal_L25p: Ribosomal_TL5_C [Tuwongella immobilis]VTS07181.1 50s ribosomal protein l25 : 50S ribosomal protein L25 OS=Singulisphaera acidiphila (strain ATCC BAA-1392 / DSM 18658 / VKM B-2454 / MOB10) GN=rplY PE=3 SV=1: Ribosomal_L25p: Ribosomal_TL5_C [Tuwongella immobilis]
MAESVILKAEPRSGSGTRNSRHLRKQGKIPAVLYGHKEATQSLVISAEDFETVMKQHARVLDVQLPEKTEKVLIRELQWDYLGKEIVHIDFYRVSADERIEVKVVVELKGMAPGALSGAGVLDQPLHELHVECPALSVPDSIRVDISKLQLGQAIHVKELTIPAGVKVLEDADAVVVQVVAAKDELAAAETGTGAEPEVIVKEKKKADADE